MTRLLAGGMAQIIPLFAMLWGAIVLKEAVTSSMTLGCGLVLLGTAIANDLFSAILRNKLGFSKR